MALEYSFMLENKQLSNVDIINELGKLGVILNENMIELLPKGIYISEPYGTLGFTVALIDTTDFPFGYESEYLLNEFKAQEELCFRMNKFSDLEQSITNMLKLIFELLDKACNDCIFEFNGDTIYLLRLNNVIYINNNSGFWNNENFKQFLRNRHFIILKHDEKI